MEYEMFVLLITILLLVSITTAPIYTNPFSHSNNIFTDQWIPSTHIWLNKTLIEIINEKCCSVRNIQPNVVRTHFTFSSYTFIAYNFHIQLYNGVSRTFPGFVLEFYILHFIYVQNTHMERISNIIPVARYTFDIRTQTHDYNETDFPFIPFSRFVPIQIESHVPYGKQFVHYVPYFQNR